MATAKDTSPAQPIDHVGEGNIIVSIFPGIRATLERTYTHDGQLKYAKSLRAEDVENAKKALDKFAHWVEMNASTQEQQAA